MNSTVHPGRLLQSSGAILLGIFVGAVLSLGTDQLLHVLKVYPPWGQPLVDPGLNALALSYRIVFNIAGCYVIARMSPYAPMGHALIGGAVGLVISAVGAYIAIFVVNLGPGWYPIALALTALPCAWMGGVLQHGLQGAG